MSHAAMETQQTRCRDVKVRRPKIIGKITPGSMANLLGQWQILIAGKATSIVYVPLKILLT